MKNSPRCVLAGALRMALASAAVAAAGLAAARGAEKTIETPLVTIHADANQDVVAEFVTRITVLAETYNDQLRMFGGTFRSKVHFYLVSKREDFTKWSGSKTGDLTWQVSGTERRMILLAPTLAQLQWGPIQQVAFVLFAESGMTQNPPAWAIQGLSTYYSLARWTGDGMVSGIIPEDLVRQVRFDVKEKRSLPIDKLVSTKVVEWYQPQARAERERQAWAMVQLLMHLENGKYRPALAGYFQDCARGEQAVPAFAKNFGGDVKTFQTKYEQWVNSPDADATAALQTQATVATLTSTLARATFLKLKFASADNFFQAAKDGNIRIDPVKNPALWLPEALLKEALAEAGKLGAWSLDTKKTPPALVLTESDGATYTGTFTLRPGTHPAVKVDRKEAKKPAAPKAATPPK